MLNGWVKLIQIVGDLASFDTEDTESTIYVSEPTDGNFSGDDVLSLTIGCLRGAAPGN